MQPVDKPPPYSEVAPPGQEHQPLLPGGYPAGPTYPPVGTAPPPPPPQQQYQHHQQGQRLPPPQGGVPAGYGSVTYVTHVPAHEVIIVGGCPACRIGVLEDDFSCLGIFCAIFFFPLGILCCLATRQRRCPNCGAIFG